MNKVYVFDNGTIVFDSSTISDEKKSEAIIIADRPIYEPKIGMSARLMWDVESQKVWYEYEPIKPFEEIIELKEQLSVISDTLDFVLSGGEV